MMEPTLNADKLTANFKGGLAVEGWIQGWIGEKKRETLKTLFTQVS